MDPRLIGALLAVIPFYIALRIAQDRNRNVWKALAAVGIGTLLFPLSWFIVIGMWMGLKTRDKKTGQLS